MATPSTATAHGHDAVDVPRGALIAIGALLALTIVAVALARWASDGRSPTEPTAPVLAERLLRFDDRSDGGIDVRLAGDGRLVRDIAPGGEPFVRGALRALARERRSNGLGTEPPFLLQAHADGRLTLIDTGTGRRLDLESFGATQAAAFARLLAPPAGR